MARKGKSGGGRKRIEMKKIESEEARQVCFSKRRVGLFTKASELSTLCGADVALVVYSPAGNPYSFGSPAVNPVVDRFLTSNSSAPSPLLTQNLFAVQQLNVCFMETTSRLEAEKAKKGMLEERLRRVAQYQTSKLLLEKMELLGLEELNLLKESLYLVRDKVNARMHELVRYGRGASTSAMGFGVGMECWLPSSSNGTERA
ncbi:agamous-like MADS-box protein AGL29 [Typha latifolia]|uniref:agamous-like MADS-box protein AGL29 n=1 Tax=Typha latifolia TaxID=4733 RepID=UPI003C2AB6C0